ncbi:PA26 p53-induced protein [Ancylostoma ceylanicum]|uniref:PA26 p53-induced protein n=1 Tax=Ancylostoma ceylanicum TaxID=53326 RepID=A0A0D6M2I5_9BILA|nr:PA26 p53-induced protein [Ancylostoma ceylanicum]
MIDEECDLHAEEGALFSRGDVEVKSFTRRPLLHPTTLSHIFPSTLFTLPNGSMAGLPELWTPLIGYTKQHQSYDELFTETISTLFYGVGNLKDSTRHFIAIMAATRHRCSFLVDLHEREFERYGGDPKWLRGLKYVDDPKLQFLDNINVILAHQPWLCNGEYITGLVHGDAQSHWSVHDLAQAVVILTHTHALCSFVHGVGAVNPSESHRSECSDWAQRNKENTGSQTGEVEELLRRMATLRRPTIDGGEMSANNALHFLALADGSSDVHSGGESPVGNSGDEEAVFSYQKEFGYVDFAARKDTAKTFKIHEFTWDHAFNLLNDLIPESAQNLDDKFDLTQKLTYSFMGGYENVDTTVYRSAVWNYIHALFGIRHDDYDYAKVNTLLSREMKTFVKTAACFPHRITDDMRASVMKDFKMSEKIHVMLLIMEARLQASLLYFTRALTNHYSQAKRASQPKRLD